MNLAITLNDSASPTVRALHERLVRRGPLNRAMGNEVLNRIRDHVRGLLAGSHNTAQKLGASPSNFVGKASNSVPTQPRDVKNDGFTVRLSHPFFARAFGDVTIRPKSGLYLTIPLIASAYNQRAYRVKDLFFWRNKKTGKSFLAEGIKAGGGVKGTIRLWYLLVESVRQSRDRSRLPTDPQLVAAAHHGADLYFKQAILQQKAANEGGSIA